MNIMNFEVIIHNKLIIIEPVVLKRRRLEKSADNLLVNCVDKIRLRLVILLFSSYFKYFVF